MIEHIFLFFICAGVVGLIYACTNPNGNTAAYLVVPSFFFMIIVGFIFYTHHIETENQLAIMEKVCDIEV